jgi:hypothetical protein
MDAIDRADQTGSADWFGWGLSADGGASEEAAWTSWFSGWARRPAAQVCEVLMRRISCTGSISSRRKLNVLNVLGDAQD